MVDEHGQLYTIEGLASAILMMTTAYLVLSSTTILTPGETHITDLQLEQLGNDALAILDTPNNYGEVSPLSNYIQTNNKTGFQTTMRQYLNKKTTGSDTIDFSASIFYVNDTGNTNEYRFIENEPYRQNAVKVSRWVIIGDAIKDNAGNPIPPDMQVERTRIVLLEVLLWRN